MRFCVTSHQRSFVVFTFQGFSSRSSGLCMCFAVVLCWWFGGGGRGGGGGGEQRENQHVDADESSTNISEFFLNS